jgi:hypothetical protein
MSYVHPTVREVQERRAELAPMDGWNERAYSALFALICSWRGIPQAYLDLGSGTGAMVNMARKMGVPAYGVDVIADSPGKEYWFIEHDLTEPLHLLSPNSEGQVFHMPEGYVEDDLRDGIHQRVVFDLVTCLEVGEHLPESAAETLCNSIARHLAVQDGILVFSAATPGQMGKHHINCQPPLYWRSLLYDRGISYREDYTRQLAHLWSWIAGPLNWLGANVQVFDK